MPYKRHRMVRYFSTYTWVDGVDASISLSFEIAINLDCISRTTAVGIDPVITWIQDTTKL